MDLYEVGEKVSVKMQKIINQRQINKEQMIKNGKVREDE